MIYGRIMLESEIEDLRQQEQFLLRAALVLQAAESNFAETARTLAADTWRERSALAFQLAAKRRAGLVD